MTLTHRAPSEPVPPMVSVWTSGWGFVSEGILGTIPGSATYEAVNRGVWHPIQVPSVCVARRIFWVNGATQAGNIEAGIYLDGGYKPGAKLITTGSVAQSAATNDIQFTDITDTTLAPGLYWLYIAASSTSTTLFRSSMSLLGGQVGWKFHQDSIGPGSAPATATPVASTGANIYFVGFSTHTIT
jgi:hypothetical protein